MQLWQATACYRALQRATGGYRGLQRATACYRVLQGATACYSVLQGRMCTRTHARQYITANCAPFSSFLQHLLQRSQRGRPPSPSPHTLALLLLVGRLELQQVQRSRGRRRGGRRRGGRSQRPLGIRATQGARGESHEPIRLLLLSWSRSRCSSRCHSAGPTGHLLVQSGEEAELGLPSSGLLARARQ